MPQNNHPLVAQPLYQQMRNMLVERIVAGRWKPGGTLPNETVLAEEFGVSIGTVRKALDTMAKERIVTRRQGRGTFVRDYTAEEAACLFSPMEDLEGRPLRSLLRGKRIAHIPASQHEASCMGVKVGDALIRVERIQIHRGQPFQTEICLLPASLYPSLPQDMMSYRIPALAQINSTIASHGDERVEIASASEEIAKDLNISEGTPVLRLVRRIISDTNNVLELRVAHCFLRAQRYVVHLR